MFKKIVSSIVGDANKKIINNLKPSVTAINALEPQLTPLSDDALRERSLALKERMAGGAELDDVLTEAFALALSLIHISQPTRPY